MRKMSVPKFPLLIIFSPFQQLTVFSNLIQRELIKSFTHPVFLRCFFPKDLVSFQIGMKNISQDSGIHGTACAGTSGCSICLIIGILRRNRRTDDHLSLILDHKISEKQYTFLQNRHHTIKKSLIHRITVMFPDMCCQPCAAHYPV